MMKISETLSETLKQTKELIGTPEKWTKGASAKNAEGIPISLLDDQATCFSLNGAMNRVLYGDLIITSERLSLLTRGTKLLQKSIILNEGFRGLDVFDGSIVLFNDHESTTHSDVLKLLDTAIQIAEMEEAASEVLNPEPTS